MQVNRFRAAALKRADKRRRESAPFARVKNIQTLLDEKGGKLILYTHPTKGHRSRQWIAGVPTFASKSDMMKRISYNLGRVMAQQMQAGIGPLNYDDARP